MMLIVACKSGNKYYGPFDTEDEAWDVYIDMPHPWDFLWFDMRGVAK